MSSTADNFTIFADIVVPKAGLEPAHPLGRGILNPLRLPFRHLGTFVNCFTERQLSTAISNQKSLFYRDTNSIVIKLEITFYSSLQTYGSYTKIIVLRPK